MVVTVEEVQAVFSPEKFAQIGFQDIAEQFSEGKTLQEMLTVSDEMMIDFYHIAMEYFDQKQYKEAADCFFLLTTLNPLECVYWKKLGNAEHHQHNWENAVNAYAMAMLADADDPFPHFYYAQVCFGQHHWEDSRKCLEVCKKLIAEDPQYQDLSPHVDALEAALAKKR